MQSRLPIVISLVVAIAAVLLTNMYINDVRREARPPTTLVVVATRNVEAGAFLEEADIAYGERYSDAVPRFAIPWAERNLYIGQEVRFPVTQGDYVLSSYFGAEVGTERTLSQRVDANLNQRAMTIPVDNEMALEGSIRPGDRIDMLITYDRVTGGETTAAAPAAGVPRGGRAEVVTVPLIENVFVLATGRFGGGADPRYRSITLLVSPDQAKLITWGLTLADATNLGKISILLRNPNDLKPTNRGAIAGGTGSLKELEQVPPIPIGDVIASGDKGPADVP